MRTDLRATWLIAQIVALIVAIIGLVWLLAGPLHAQSSGANITEVSLARPLDAPYYPMPDWRLRVTVGQTAFLIPRQQFKQWVLAHPEWMERK